MADVRAAYAVEPGAAYAVEPDVAARAALRSAVVWLAVAATSAFAVSALAVDPNLFGGLELLSAGRLRAFHDSAAVFGWLTVAGFGALFAFLPRLCGVQLHNEVLGATTVVWWNLILGAGAISLLFGLNQGRPWAELPFGADLGLAALAVLVAYNAALTAARRAQRTLYVAAWYLLAGAVALPVVYVAGNLTVLSGLADVLVQGFYVQALQNAWLLATGLAAAYVVVPQVTGNPLHSRRLAAIGFWTLLAAGSWTGAAGGVWGPAPGYVQSIGVAMSFVLLVPALSVASNLFATARGRWSLLADDYGLRFAAVGTAALVVWTAAAAVSSTRTISRMVGLTSWTAGLRTLAIYGVLSPFALATVYHAYPRLVGRAWYSRRACSFHFWVTLGGVAVAAGALLAAGVAQGALWRGWAAAGDPSAFRQVAALAGRAYARLQAAGALAWAAVAAAQYVLVWNAFRTARRGDPLVLAPRGRARVGAGS